MARKFADGTEENIAGTKAISPIYSKKFAACGMSFDLPKAA